MVGLTSMTVSEDQVKQAMRKWWQDYGVMIDPHTAVAAYASFWKRDQEIETPMVVVETAQPVKFRATIESVLGVTPPAPKGLDLAEFEGRRTFEYLLPPDVNTIKQFIGVHSR